MGLIVVVYSHGNKHKVGWGWPGASPACARVTKGQRAARLTKASESIGITRAGLMLGIQSFIMALTLI